MRSSSAADLERRVGAFFDEFVDAFGTFDGATIARRYLTPWLAFQGNGSARVFATPEETAAYFQGVVDGHRANGCRRCRYRDLAVLALGRDCALGTVSWELLADDATVLGSWRESYNLCLVDGRFMVFASTDHAA